MNRSDRQAMAAFGTAPIDHLAAVFGRHARPEAVCPLAFDDAGLKCTLHGDAPGQYRSREARVDRTSRRADFMEPQVNCQTLVWTVLNSPDP